MNKTKYRKVLKKLFFFIGLAVLWFLGIFIYSMLFQGTFQEMKFLAKSGLIVLLIVAIFIIILFGKFVSTKEFLEFKEENKTRRYERKKQKGTLYKYSFFEKKKFYFVTVPIGLLSWILIFAIAPESGPILEISALVVGIYTIFVIACIVLRRVRYYQRKDGTYF